MAVKSVIEIDVDPNGTFARFTALYEKYQKALKTAPAEWAKVTQAIGQSRSEFEQIVKQQIASQARAKLIAEAQKEAARVMGDNVRQTRSWADAWESVSHRSQTVLRNVGGIANTLTRVSALGGLVGIGGLFGIDRLAGSVAGTRSSSFGLGIGYGAQRAFGANFDRLIDPGSFLSTVASAKGDITQRVGLIGAGLNQREIEGDTASTAIALLRRYKSIADSTDPGLFQQVINSRRLPGASIELFNKLRATSGGELQSLYSEYAGNKSRSDLPPDVQRAYQDFETRLKNAGNSIESTFVRGLVPLIPGLNKLSTSFENVVRSFVKDGGPLEKWITKAGDGLEKFATYIGTDSFESNIKNFVDGAAKLANGVAWIVSKLPGDATNFSGATVGAVTGGLVGGVPGAVVGGYLGSKLPSNVTLWNQPFGSIGVTAQPFHNPGNLRPPGQKVGFAAFPTDEAGLRAMARQIQIYSRRDNLNTVEGIVSKYAPASENNVPAYVSDVSRRSGFGPNQRIDTSDVQALSRVLAAMIAHEQRGGSYDKYKDAKVVVEIIKPAGGDTAVSVNGLKN